MSRTSKKRIQVQVDRDLAAKGDAVLNQLGLTPATAITMLYTRLVAEGGLPFSTKLTQREQDELAIKDLTKDWPRKKMDGKQR